MFSLSRQRGLYCILTKSSGDLIPGKGWTVSLDYISVLPNELSWSVSLPWLPAAILLIIETTHTFSDV